MIEILAATSIDQYLIIRIKYMFVKPNLKLKY